MDSLDGQSVQSDETYRERSIHTIPDLLQDLPKHAPPPA